MEEENDPALTEEQRAFLALKQRIENPPEPIIIIDMTAEPLVVERRTGDRLEAISRALYTWRRQHWRSNYQYCAWGEEALLPAQIIKFLAANAHIRTVANLQKYAPEWIWIQDIGLQVLDIIQITDDAWKEAEQEKQARKRQKSAENRLAAQTKRNLERRQETAAKRAQFRAYDTNTTKFSAASSSAQPVAGPSTSAQAAIQPQPSYMFYPWSQDATPP